MKIAILTNDDLTGNLIFSPLIGLPGVSVKAVLISESPMKGRRSAISAAIGLRRKMAFRYWLFLVISNGLFSVFAAFGAALRLKGGYGELDSLRAHAREAGTPFLSCVNFNSAETKALLRDLSVDLLVIRVSAILDREVLAIPDKGTWCVHSSLLPAYGGIAGEFHALREGATTIGSTVFEVAEKLDAGPPLAQVAVPVRERGSLFSHIVANNRAAGRLLAQMVENMAMGRPPAYVLLNKGLEPSYFSWPQPQQVTEFGQKGYQLMRVREVFRLGLSALRLGRGFARFD